MLAKIYRHAYPHWELFFAMEIYVSTESTFNEKLIQIDDILGLARYAKFQQL